MRSARELAETALQLLRETVWARITARTIEVFHRGKAPLIAGFEVSMGGDEHAVDGAKRSPKQWRLMSARPNTTLADSWRHGIPKSVFL